MDFFTRIGNWIKEHPGETIALTLIGIGVGLGIVEATRIGGSEEESGGIESSIGALTEKIIPFESPIKEGERCMPRYKVEFKAFKTGEWYTKTETDNPGSAWSVAKVGNNGRAVRLIDALTGDILYSREEEPGANPFNKAE